MDLIRIKDIDGSVNHVDKINEWEQKFLSQFDDKTKFFMEKKSYTLSDYSPNEPRLIDEFITYYSLHGKVLAIILETRDDFNYSEILLINL